MRQQKYENGLLAIGELSRLTGINIETIRYYERIRLMPRPPRTRGGHRSYGPDGLQTLTFIKRSRELGFGLDDIRALLSLRNSQQSCMDVKTIADRHLGIVRKKMRDLEEMEKSLAEIAGLCDGDQGSACPILAALEVCQAEAPTLA